MKNLLFGGNAVSALNFASNKASQANLSFHRPTRNSDYSMR